MDLQQKDFYERVYEGYKKIAGKYEKRFVIIDSGLEIDLVSSQIVEVIKQKGIV